MDWTSISSVFVLATVKFMIAPVTGATLGLGFLQAMISSALGAWTSASVFYFLSDFFLSRARDKRIEKAKLSDAPIKLSKKKRVVNKFIVRIKNSLGIYGLCFFAPLFLSVPIGTIICAKFFYKKKMTFPLIIISLGINSLLLSLLSFLFF